MNFRKAAGLFLGGAALLAVLFLSRAAAAEPSPPSDAELVQKQRDLEKDLEARVQNILDKILGPNQAEVKARVNLSIDKLVQKKAGAGQQARKKEENPLGDTKFILPGVPAPKNVGKEKEPENVQKQQMEQERSQTQVSFRVNVSNREVIAFYNEKMKDKEPEARKAIMAVTDLKQNELKFIPGRFFDRWSNFKEDFVHDPRNIFFSILLFLLLLLLVWLFVPLTGFFQNYIRAMKEKGGIEVKMESTSEEEGMNKEGLTPEEMLAQEGDESGQKEGDEDMANKKYVPFEYINEENMKRLLGVFRKEPPQVIALVLSYLKPELVRHVYGELPIDLQTLVAAESAAVRQTSEDQVRRIDADIKAKIDFLVGGVDNLITILGEVDYKIRDNILEYLKDHKPQLYQKVRDALLLFDDIPTFPDLAMQIIIRELKTEQLARALKNTSPEIMNKFMSNMSQGGAALLKEEMEFGRPVSEEQVQMERQDIMNRVKQLETEGKIQVRDKKKISIFESEDATSPLTPSLPDEGRRGGMEAPLPGAGFAGGAAEAPASQAAPAAPATPAGAAADYLAYGLQLYGEQKYEEAAGYLQYAAQQDPANVETFQALGHCYYGLGLVNEALQYYEHALSLNPQDEALRQWVEQFKQNANV